MTSNNQKLPIVTTFLESLNKEAFVPSKPQIAKLINGIKSYVKSETGASTISTLREKKALDEITTAANKLKKSVTSGFFPYLKLPDETKETITYRLLQDIPWVLKIIFPELTNECNSSNDYFLLLKFSQWCFDVFGLTKENSDSNPSLLRTTTTRMRSRESKPSHSNNNPSRTSIATTLAYVIPEELKKYEPQYPKTWFNRSRCMRNQSALQGVDKFLSSRDKSVDYLVELFDLRIEVINELRLADLNISLNSNEVCLGRISLPTSRSKMKNLLQYHQIRLELGKNLREIDDRFFLGIDGGSLICDDNLNRTTERIPQQILKLRDTMISASMQIMGTPFTVIRKVCWNEVVKLQSIDLSILNCREIDPPDFFLRGFWRYLEGLRQCPVYKPCLENSPDLDSPFLFPDEECGPLTPLSYSELNGETER